MPHKSVLKTEKKKEVYNCNRMGGERRMAVFIYTKPMVLEFWKFFSEF
jgi:hypothetical protein